MASELASLMQNRFAVAFRIGRAGQDAADVEQGAAGPDQLALQRNAFHADRAAKADVGLEHAVAFQVAQFDVRYARIAVLQRILGIAQQELERSRRTDGIAVAKGRRRQNIACRRCLPPCAGLVNNSSLASFAAWVPATLPSKPISVIAL